MNAVRVAAALRELAAAIEDAAAPAAAGAVLTVALVAEQLHRSASTVRGWCEAGRFAGAFKLEGRDWRIPVAAIDAFLADQRAKTSREDAPRATIAPRADTGVPPRRVRKGDAADLGAWRQARGDGGGE